MPRRGHDDYLTKPIRTDALGEMIVRWIGTATEAEISTPADSSPPDRPEVAQLDHDRLAMLRDLDEGDGTLIMILVDEFTSEAHRQLNALRDGVAEGDPQAVERAAHSIKGSSANLGAIRLSELTGHLEELARAGALGSVQSEVAAIAVEFESVQLALAALVEVPTP